MAQVKSPFRIFPGPDFEALTSRFERVTQLSSVIAFLEVLGMKTGGARSRSGRKPLGEKARTEKLAAYFTAAEFERVKASAAEAGIAPAIWLRLAALGKLPSAE